MQLKGHSSLWPAIFPPHPPHVDILIPAAGGGKALARDGGRGGTLCSEPLKSTPLKSTNRLSVHLRLSPWACASRLHCVPRYLKVTAHVSTHGCVRAGVRL